MWDLMVQIYSEDRLVSKEVGGFPSSKNRHDPNIQTIAIAKNGTVYDPVASRIYPAKSGAANNMTFMGTIDIPVIAAKARRPK